MLMTGKIQTGKPFEITVEIKNRFLLGDVLTNEIEKIVHLHLDSAN